MKNKDHFQIFGITTSNFELLELLKAWLVVGIAFAVVLSKQFGSFFQAISVALICVGTGFLFHELGHKISAIKKGYFAEFRSNGFMLFLALLFSLFGFIFAAPGAVVIYPKVDIYGRKRGIHPIENGIISMWGPLTNIILAVVFLGLTFIVKTGFANTIFKYGLLINAWIAFFNMLPFGNFDGKKIFFWNKLVYFAILACSVLLMTVYYL